MARFSPCTAINGEGTKPLIYAIHEALEQLAIPEVADDDEDEEAADIASGEGIDDERLHGRMISTTRLANAKRLVVKVSWAATADNQPAWITPRSQLGRARCRTLPPERQGSCARFFGRGCLRRTAPGLGPPPKTGATKAGRRRHRPGRPGASLRSRLQPIPAEHRADSAHPRRPSPTASVTSTPAEH